MQIVIDIPEEMYKSIEQGSFGAKYTIYDLIGCVMNGKPLPEGHGRLIDESKIKRVSTWDNGYADCDAPTIIEADISAEIPIRKCIRCGKEIKPGEYVRLRCCKNCDEILEEKKRIWIANNSNYRR